ncbi:low affinity immunoglobulin gamma Fc region receptor II-like, partial [Pyrgilauda ruficollis]|uniref:low affinity immunoglobulin gamma Fc region receptor II-like n=1 Tax=Pyrgilauda ruficollis TaxID=221976 RepID=UPI001B87289C
MAGTSWDMAGTQPGTQPGTPCLVVPALPERCRSPGRGHREPGGFGDPREEPPELRERGPALVSLSRVAAATALRGPGLPRAAGTGVLMAGDTGMARKVTLLLWAQTLGLTGAQTTQLLVEPPWLPAVLWDQVTLTCQGSGTAGATTWYKDWRRWWQKGPDSLTVTGKGTYTCDRPDTGLSPSVRVSDDLLVLQVPARALLEGDTVTLRCRGWRDKPLTSVKFYREEKLLRGPPAGTELSLSPLQLSHSGRYRCEGRVESKWKQSELVTVTVHSAPPSGVSLSAQPPGGQVALGDRLVLSCTVAMGTGPLSFSWHREGSGALLSTNQHLELPHVGDSDSGQYRCRVSDGDSVAQSDPLNVTVLVPVANATITLSPPAHQVRAGDNVTLR